MKVVLIFAIAGYVCGSFMSAYYIPQWLYDMDVALMSDDGNPGAANVFKNAGVPCGILVLAADLICTLFTGQPVRRAFLCVIVMSLN